MSASLELEIEIHTLQFHVVFIFTPLDDVSNILVHLVTLNLSFKLRRCISGYSLLRVWLSFCYKIIKFVKNIHKALSFIILNYSSMFSCVDVHLFMKYSFVDRLENLRVVWRIILKWGIRTSHLEGLDWIHLSQDMIQWLDLVVMLINFRVPQKQENFLTSWAITSFSRSLLNGGFYQFRFSWLKGSVINPTLINSV